MSRSPAAGSVGSAVYEFFPERGGSNDRQRYAAIIRRLGELGRDTVCAMAVGRRPSDGVEFDHLRVAQSHDGLAERTVTTKVTTLLKSADADPLRAALATIEEMRAKVIDTRRRLERYEAEIAEAAKTDAARLAEAAIVGGHTLSPLTRRYAAEAQDAFDAATAALKLLRDPLPDWRAELQGREIEVERCLSAILHRAHSRGLKPFDEVFSAIQKIDQWPPADANANCAIPVAFNVVLPFTLRCGTREPDTKSNIGSSRSSLGDCS